MTTHKLPELLAISDRRSAMHLVDIVTQNAKSYCELAEFIGLDAARELLPDGANFYGDEPTAVAKKRSVSLMSQKWTFHRCRVMAADAASEADRRYRDMARAMGIDETTAETFLQSYYNRRTNDELATLFFASLPKPKKLGTVNA